MTDPHSKVYDFTPRVDAAFARRLPVLVVSRTGDTAITRSRAEYDSIEKAEPTIRRRHRNKRQAQRHE